jgi:hypothetical protein
MRRGMIICCLMLPSLRDEIFFWARVPGVSRSSTAWLMAVMPPASGRTHLTPEASQLLARDFGASSDDIPGNEFGPYMSSEVFARCSDGRDRGRNASRNDYLLSDAVIPSG